MAPANIKINPVGVIILASLILFACYYYIGLPKLLSGSDEGDETKSELEVHQFDNNNRHSRVNISLIELLSVGIDVAQRGGIKLRQIQEDSQINAVSKGDTDEGAKEIMTTGDLESHNIMYYGIRKAFPGVKIISEEKTQNVPDMDSVPEPSKHCDAVASIIHEDSLVPEDSITVWIDPLDATQEYTENLTQYVTTMVCIAVNGAPIIGVIYQPFLKNTAWAWVGHGHSTNLDARDTTSHGDKDVIIVSRSHKAAVEVDAKKYFGDDIKIIDAGGAGYKVLSVINGTADAYFHTSMIKKWDICAGNALLEAINGKMTTSKGAPIDYTSSSLKDVFITDGLLSASHDHDKFLQKIMAKLENL